MFWDVGLLEVGLVEVGLLEVGLLEVGLLEVGLLEVGGFVKKDLRVQWNELLEAWHVGLGGR